MIDLFYMGGPLFMGILTIILFTAVAVAVYIFVRGGKESKKRISPTVVKEIGIFGLVFGIFGQFMGLYQAFTAIEQMGSVSPALLAGGLKVSAITTLYGMVIFVITWLLYFGLKAVVLNK